MTKKALKYFFLLISTVCCFGSTAYSQTSLVKTIYFKSNSAAIDRKYDRALDLIVKKLNTDSFSFLKVFGYADKKGSEVYNDSLSAKRANAVYDYLAARVKIDAKKNYVSWIGESGADVAYDLHFPYAKIQKRCVDIWVTFYRQPKTEKVNQEKKDR